MDKNIRFKPSNELTFHTVQLDRKRLLKYLQDTEITSVNVDLNHVSHCDSAGLALLIEAKRLCGQYRKALIIDYVPQEVHALAEFCGLDILLYGG